MLIKIADSLLSNNPDETKNLVIEALNLGFSAKDVLQGLIDGMEVVGGKFRDGEIFVPEVLISAMGMNMGMDILQPLLQNDQNGISSKGKVIIGTVNGDIHDIGKNLVAIMLKGAGFDVIDIGVDVKPVMFEKAIIEHKPDLVCCSAMLTTTMTEMPKLIKYLKDKNLRKDIKVVLGGAPITEKWALEAGADGYGEDAASAVEIAKKLLQ